MLDVTKLATSSFHPTSNSGTERVNHSMAQMLSCVVNERQDNWDVQLPYVELTYNDSVSAATGLAPNEIHLGRQPRFPITVFELGHMARKQSLQRDQLAYCGLVKDCQRRAYDLVHEHL